MSLTVLPVELISQIMCYCREIITVVNLSSTCRQTQAVLRMNTRSIVSAVLATPSEADFQATLDLAGVEASIANSENGAIASRGDVNATVYNRLFYIHRSADSVAKLRKRLRVDHVDTAPMLTTHDIMARHRYTVTTAMFWQCYIKIRMLAIGYDHIQYLPAAYISIHDSSVYELELMYTFMELFQVHWDLNTWQYRNIAMMKEARKMSNKEDEENIPKSMHFAQLAIQWECMWCVEGESERECRQHFRWIHEKYGQERVALMYGANKKPWRKWPRKEFWPSPTQSEIEDDRESTALDMAEEETWREA